MGTFDGATIRIYLDGALAGATAAGGAINNPASPSFLIGKNATSTASFNGLLEEVAIYGSALSTPRVLAHYQAGRPGVAVARGTKPSSYSANVLSDNPIGYYRLDESGGPSAFDSSLGGNTGTYSGTVVYGPPGALTPDSDPAVQFDGTTGTVALNLRQIDTTSGHQVTVEFWMYWFGGSAVTLPFGFNLYDLNIAPSAPAFGFNTGHGDIYGVPLSALTANTWAHITAVFTNGAVTSNQLYINGVAQSLSQLSGAPVNPIVTANAAISGWGYDGTSKFNGLIDDVSIYNGALSPARVVAHYRAGRTAPSIAVSYASSVSSDSPVAYWRLGDRSGTTAAAVVGPAGTYSGATTLGEPGVIPMDNSTSVRFDGSNGTTVVLNSLPVNTSAGQQTTVEFWMYWMGGSGYQMPFGFNTYNLSVVPGNGFGFNTGNSDVYGVPISAIAANSWIHVAAVFTNGSFASNQLYLNGVPQSISQLFGTPASVSVTTNGAISGWGSSGAYKFNGLISDVAIYNGALPAARIQAHYAAGLATSPRRVNSVLDARGNTVSTFFYNDDSATTRVLDGRGLNSYYTFQSYGGRTLSVTDTGGNVTASWALCRRRGFVTPESSTRAG